MRPGSAIMLWKFNVDRSRSFWPLTYLLRSTLNEILPACRPLRYVPLPLYRTATSLNVLPANSRSAWTYSNSTPLTTPQPLRWPSAPCSQSVDDADPPPAPLIGRIAAHCSGVNRRCAVHTAVGENRASCVAGTRGEGAWGRDSLL